MENINNNITIKKDMNEMFEFIWINHDTKKTLFYYTSYYYYMNFNKLFKLIDKLCEFVINNICTQYDENTIMCYFTIFQHVTTLNTMHTTKISELQMEEFKKVINK